MTIVVKEEHQSSECDDCGHFSDCTVTVTENGKEIARLVSDGHMGGGDFDEHSPASAIAAFIRKLKPGAEVSVDGPSHT